MFGGILERLPAKEQFQVVCYGLRSITDEQREALFECNPAFQRIYAVCLLRGEMGKRLDELPKEIIEVIDSDEVLLAQIKADAATTPHSEGESHDNPNPCDD